MDDDLRLLAVMTQTKIKGLVISCDSVVPNITSKATLSTYLHLRKYFSAILGTNRMQTD